MTKQTYIGNGRNKNFYFTFPFFSPDEVLVKINDIVAVDYGLFCVPGVSNQDFPFTGGHVKFTKPPKPTDIITIERNLQYNRVIDYQETAKINPTTLNQDMNYFFESLKDIKSELLGFAETYKEFTNTESAQELLARIDAVIEEIDNLGDISTITDSISELGTSITNLTNSLNGLTATVGTHTTDIGILSAFKDGVLDYVVESQEPTAENNYTWYRKYKSGWVEQGGIYMSSSGTGDITVVFPIEFINNFYTLNITLRLSTRSESTSSKNECNVISLNTTSFTTHIDSNLPGKFWTAFGFAAA